jgi:DNA-binding NarL/FixJ family response regulator
VRAVAPPPDGDDLPPAGQRRALRVALRLSDPEAEAGLTDALRAAGLMPLGDGAADLPAPDAVLTDAPPSPAAGAGGPPVLVLAEGAPAMLRALRAGARGVLPAGAPAGEVVAALAVVARGAAVLPPGLLRGLLGPPPVVAEDRPREAPPPPETAAAGVVLTPREREVLDLLAAGASNKVIARRLGLSFHTAKAHVASVLQKLGAGSRADAVARGARAGLVLL